MADEYLETPCVAPTLQSASNNRILQQEFLRRNESTVVAGILLVPWG